MSNSESISFTAIYSEGIIDEKNIELFANKIKSMGYQVTSGYAWPFKKPNNLITEPIKITKEIKKISNANGFAGSLDFWKYPLEFSFQLTHASNEHHEWIISIQRDVLDIDNYKYVDQNLREFIDIIKIALATFPALYGGILSDEDYLDLDEVKYKENANIYLLTYMNSDYITHYTEDFLLACPASNIEILINGIVISSSLENIYENDLESIEEIKEYFENRTT